MSTIPTADGGKLTTLTVFGRKIEAILVQTDEGTEREYRGRNSSRKRTVTVGREWDVFLPDGTFIGTICYAMITRERRTGQRTYVDARWESPGWTYRTPASDGTRKGYSGFEGYSKGESVERLIRDHERSTR